MKFQYIAEYRGVLTRSHLCRLMGVSERGLHAWKHRPPSYRQRRDMVLLAHIRDQHRLLKLLALQQRRGTPSARSTGRPT